MLQSLILAAGLAAVSTYAQTAPAYNYTVNGNTYTNPTNIYIPSADAAVPGALFDHLFVIIFENTDFVKAYADPNFQTFIKEGVTLVNSHATGHPSEPQYINIATGWTYGLNDDSYVNLPPQVSTYIDLLEPKNVTYRVYEEEYPGGNWTGPISYNGDYFRKHSPGGQVASVYQNPVRYANYVNSSQMATDLAAGFMPNVGFYIPNMADDGHNTSVAVAGEWLNTFLPPLMANDVFWNKTAVLLHFDENETYDEDTNAILTVLLSDLLPTTLKGTNDTTYFRHTGILKMMEENWGLGNLGLGDVVPQTSNIPAWVATQLNYTNTEVPVTPITNGTNYGPMEFNTNLNIIDNYSFAWPLNVSFNAAQYIGANATNTTTPTSSSAATLFSGSFTVVALLSAAVALLF